MIVSGLYTVLITPFLPNGEFDEDGFRENIRYQISHDVDGIVVLGTTGESPTINHQERERVIRTAVSETRGKIPVMVGTGTYDTRETIKYTQEAEEYGADQALIVSPYYNRPTQEGMYRHFKAIADAVSIPILTYNIQGRTGQNIQTDTLKRLAEIPNIVGVKEASGNIPQIGEVIEHIARHRPDFSVMSGDDALTFSIMGLGGHGILSVISNLVPQHVRTFVHHLEAGDYDKARELHYYLMPLIRGAFIETNPMPIKAAMQWCGMPAGGCRLPLCEMLPENQQKLKRILEKYDLSSVVARKEQCTTETQRTQRREVVSRK